MVDTNNIHITVSLSDETIEKLASIFSSTTSAEQPVNRPRTLLQSYSEQFSREETADESEKAPDETGDQCGWVDGRVSKAKRIDNKKNQRIGEPYWCRKPEDHTGKHVEGFLPAGVEEEAVEVDSQQAEPEATDTKKHGASDGPTHQRMRDAIKPALSDPEARGRESVVLEVKRLEGYASDSRCGWWSAGNSAKFCELNAEHSESASSEDHTWVSPAPVMERAG